jgi:hypothetical protein
MNKKFILWLSFVAVFSFTLQSCRTDEVVQEEKQTQREKIAAFERFENNLASKKFLQKDDLGYISYHEPFKDIVQAYMSNNPSFNQKFHDEAGDIYFEVRSFTYGETIKGLAYPIIKDGVVNAVLVGIVNPERDWVNFTVLKNNSPEVLQIISKFQTLYTASQLSKGREQMQEHDIEEVVITIYQAIPGPSYTYYIPWFSDYGGSQSSGLGAGMSGGGSHYGGNGDGQNPCQKAITENTSAKNELTKIKTKNRVTQIKQNVNTNLEEKGFSFGVDSNGAEQVSNVKVGVGGYAVDLVVSSPSFTITGAAHTHTTNGFNVPSTGDMYNMYKAVSANANFKYYYTFSPNNNNYVLTITNPANFVTFNNNYPDSIYFDAENYGFNSNTSIGMDYDYIVDYFTKVMGKTEDEGNEYAMAYVMNKYNTGMALNKEDASGNFKPLFLEETVTQIPNPSSPNIPILLKTYKITQNCNLK